VVQDCRSLPGEVTLERYVASLQLSAEAPTRMELVSSQEHLDGSENTPGAEVVRYSDPKTIAEPVLDDSNVSTYTAIRRMKSNVVKMMSIHIHPK